MALETLLGDGDPCPNCVYGKRYTGSTLTHESEPWVECELCHKITDVEFNGGSVTFDMLEDFIARTLRNEK